MKPGAGVRGIGDWKFWAVLSLYFLSCVLLYQTGMNHREFSVVFSVCVAYFVMSTVAWEYRMLGAPERPEALLLQIAFGITLVFVFNVAVFSLGATVEESCAWFVGLFGLDAASDALAGNAAASVMGRLLKPVFSTVLSVFLFIAVPLVLSLRRSWSVPLLLTLFFGLSLLTLRNGIRPAAWMLAGMTAFAGAFALQREDEQQKAFWRLVRERMADAPEQPRAVSRMKFLLLERLFDQKSLDEAEIRGVVARCLGCAAHDPASTEASRFLVSQLTHGDNLAAIRSGVAGSRLAPNTPPRPDGVFLRLALIPKGLIVLLFSVLYILSPIDLIPDYIPVYGVVDDLAMGVFGALALSGTYRRLRDTGRTDGEVFPDGGN